MRYDFDIRQILWLFPVLAGLLPLPVLCAGEPLRPNIVLILADDLGYGDLSFMGQRNFSTPNIDRMAREGLHFTDHYSGSTVCGPSRACLMTGYHTGHVYQRFNGRVQFRPDPHDVTVARLLQKAGYHTAMIGKSGLSCNSQDGKLPNQKGFDHFFGFVSHSAAHRYYPRHLWRNGKKLTYAENHQSEGEHYSGDLFLADTLSYLEEHADEPFFLHLSLQQPHADLNVPEKWKQPWIGKFRDQPYKGGHYRGEEHPKATYAGMITYLDHSVGQVLAKLRALGIEKNTLVIFSSDNGAMSEGGWRRKNFNSSGPLRGGKRDLYEGGIRVPTIAWWPSQISPGRKSDHISAFWDFLPTACDLAGVSIPSGIDGISYAPTLLECGVQKEHHALYWEFYEGGGKQAMRMGKWKGVRVKVTKDMDSHLELYDLDADLGEKRNVAGDYPEIVEQISRQMLEEHTESELIQFSRRPKAARLPTSRPSRRDNDLAGERKGFAQQD